MIEKKKLTVPSSTRSRFLSFFFLRQFYSASDFTRFSSTRSKWTLRGLIANRRERERERENMHKI